MTFRVEVSDQAERDSDAILAWLLSHEAGEAGISWFEALHDAIQSLAQYPKRCGLAPEDKVFPFEVRQLLYGQKPHIYRTSSRLKATRSMFCISAMVVVNR
jgi:plasmid stabilization system protein ParE